MTLCSGTNCTNVRETNPGLFFFLCLRNEAEDEKIMTYGKEVKSVDAFCYLGSLMAAVVDWPAGTPGKIPVGRTAGAGDIWAATAASTLNKLTNLREACS